MMREASDTAADSTILPFLVWDDLDHDAFARYRRRHQTRDPGSPRNGYDDQRFLQAIGGYRRDPETGGEGITVAGLLMFGLPETLRHWRGRHLIDYRLLPADVSVEARWDDRVVWEGNLFGAFETIYPKLTEGQPVPFRLLDGVRIDDTPVHIALREALINLLAHADYAEPQASLIIRAPEGYAFRNPGDSRISVSDLLTGDRSDPRNPELVRMFRYIGLADEGGTGMPKILGAWRELGFQLPRIDVGTERYEFAMRLRHAHLIADDDRAWLRTLGEEWTEAEQLALVLARHEGDVDNVRLRSLTRQHPTDVTKILGSLRDRELLQMIGGGRNARYELGPAVLRQEALRQEALRQEALRQEVATVATTGPQPDAVVATSSDATLASARKRVGARRRPLEDRIIRQLRLAGPHGLTFREITRRLRDKTSDELRQVLDQLVNAGRVDMRDVVVREGRRPSTRYFLAGVEGP